MPAPSAAGGEEVAEVAGRAGDARQHEEEQDHLPEHGRSDLGGCSSIGFSVLPRLRTRGGGRSTLLLRAHLLRRGRRRRGLGRLLRRRRLAARTRRRTRRARRRRAPAARPPAARPCRCRWLEAATRAWPAALSRRSRQVLLDTVQRVAGAADRGDHAGRHLLKLGLGLEHLRLGHHPLELLDLVLRVAHGDVARLHELLVGVLGRLELLAVLVELLLDGLQLQGVLPRRVAVADLQVGGRLGREVALLRLEVLHLAQQPLGEAGVVGEVLVEPRDLRAQVLLLGLDERLRVLPLEAGDEEAQEPLEEVRDTAEHGGFSSGRTGPASRPHH